MKIAIPVHDGRISPVFDAARHLLVVEIQNGEMVSRNQVALLAQDIPSRAHVVAGLGVEVLICGAISRPLEVFLGSLGVAVIARKRGAAEEILTAFLADELGQDAFLMPGCRERGRCKRGRRHNGQPHNNG
jgi:predicted Fe-Mo cluster-binding NifX family protein